MRVIGAGFGRTGTLSLKVALEELGFGPCEHMINLLAHPERIERWEEAARRRDRGEPIDWGGLLDGYGATVDWPGCAFWEELAIAYPEAKVVLTVRDPERWYESARRTIHDPRRRREISRIAAALAGFVGLVAPDVRRALRLTDRVIWDGTFGGRFADRGHALRVFADHAKAVTAHIPPERLLVYEVAEGWGPLCAFLGVEPPADRPFPHLNDAAAFRRRLYGRLALGLGAMVAIAAAGTYGGLVATRFVRSRR